MYSDWQWYSDREKSLPASNSYSTDAFRWAIRMGLTTASNHTCEAYSNGHICPAVWSPSSKGRLSWVCSQAAILAVWIGWSWRERSVPHRNSSPPLGRSLLSSACTQDGASGHSLLHFAGLAGPIHIGAGMAQRCPHDHGHKDLLSCETWDQVFHHEATV